MVPLLHGAFTLWHLLLWAKTWHPHLHESQRTTHGVFFSYDVGHREGTQVSMLGRITFSTEPSHQLVTTDTEFNDLCIRIYILGYTPTMKTFS